MALYPMKFDPILKTVIWGGSEICKFKEISPKQDSVGESWEISGVDGNVSMVSNGNLKGDKLDVILSKYKEELLGKYIPFADKIYRRARQPVHSSASK